jgi:hypothetical protein
MGAFLLILSLDAGNLSKGNGDIVEFPNFV